MGEFTHPIIPDITSNNRIQGNRKTFGNIKLKLLKPDNTKNNNAVTTVKQTSRASTTNGDHNFVF
ncbi:hypothetical protein PIROE2DRAFT_18387 [Piromyces sp. E2]|nr:hypothetical protein PIROE2DRAFT_18387 [Piromyces sp. E2]|eukprot:OUM56834.1 hypothetical protein PIROE2DRAFT_18387 [Piromyces sp. E2]